MEDLSYETAKKLKDAGFPQGTHVPFSHPRLGIQEVESSYVHLPTLEELIEVCGKQISGFTCRAWTNGKWQAFDGDSLGGIVGEGINLKEAVANLILSLVDHGLLTLTK